ncbi:MAG: sigma 54-interacting transcriptional regulator [Treponema sp.]|nr:sigma 54-interacting transcriptional regulator [Treponema sp.]
MELYIYTPSPFVLRSCQAALKDSFTLNAIETKDLAAIQAATYYADGLLLDYSAFSRKELETLLSLSRCGPGGGCRVFLLTDADTQASHPWTYEGRATELDIFLPSRQLVKEIQAGLAASSGQTAPVPAQDHSGNGSSTSSGKRKPFQDRARAIARTSADILLLGESGAGKSWLAEKIYSWSGRKGNFISESLANISPALFESELFGTVTGAYTDSTDKMGLLEAAGSGTLFLDEIGELPLHLQSKLFSALDRRAFRRVGSITEQPFRGRLIFATNKDLGEAVRNGSFREELYNRISMVTLHVPPLREHPYDIPSLASQFASDEGKRLSPGALEKLGGYQYPGNIRELKHIIYRSCLLCGRTVLEADDIILENSI